MRLAAAALIVAALAVVGCSGDAGVKASSTASPTPTVDRTDPESVLRAYYAAWERGDWAAMSSFMDEKYGIMPEPLESLRIVGLTQRWKSQTRCVYDVGFEIRVGPDWESMSSGGYEWTYTLGWDAAGQSWLITDYGI